MFLIPYATVIVGATPVIVTALTAGVISTPTFILGVIPTKLMFTTGGATLSNEGA